MPRDFVPCQYVECLLPDDEGTKRCQVIECFVGAHIATRDLLFTMSLDSHAYYLDTDPDDGRAREHLFGIFDAAMAALE